MLAWRSNSCRARQRWGTAVYRTRVFWIWHPACQNSSQTRRCIRGPRRTRASRFELRGTDLHSTALGIARVPYSNFDPQISHSAAFIVWASPNTCWNCWLRSLRSPTVVSFHYILLSCHSFWNNMTYFTVKTLWLINIDKKTKPYLKMQPMFTKISDFPLRGWNFNSGKYLFTTDTK